MKIYLVGGAVRDLLLGRKVTERDFVVVGATVIDMQELGFQQVGKDFPVFLHPQTKEEYALARTERKTGKGYIGFECFSDTTVTLEQDLQRRDLTINAMAVEWDVRAEQKSTENLSLPDAAVMQNIIDPFGGQQDLQAKILRHISPAFAEDPVRILRVARFAARFPDFTVHPDTNRLMQNMVAAGEVDALVHERVWKEFSRALTKANTGRFFSVLRECGALPILFPEFAKNSSCFDYLQRSQISHHHKKHVTEKAPAIFKSHFEHKTEHYPLKTPRYLLRFGALTLGLNKAEIITLCHRLHAPTRFSEIALLVSTYFDSLQNLKINDPTEVINFLERLDSYRRPHRLFDFCHIANVKLQDEEIINTLFDAFVTTKAINATPFIQQGLQREDIGKAVHQARIAKLKAKSSDTHVGAA